LRTPESALQRPGLHVLLTDTTQRITARQTIATPTRLVKVDSNHSLALATKTTKVMEEHVLSFQLLTNVMTAVISVMRTLPVLTQELVTTARATRALKTLAFKPPTEEIASPRPLAATLLNSLFRMRRPASLTERSATKKDGPAMMDLSLSKSNTTQEQEHTTCLNWVHGRIMRS